MLSDITYSSLTIRTCYLYYRYVCLSTHIKFIEQLFNVYFNL
jgi:hypothetical protein